MQVFMLGELEAGALREIAAAADQAALDAVRVRYLGKKGSLTRSSSSSGACRPVSARQPARPSTR